MPRFITLGTYTNQGAAGLVDGDSDRKAAMDVAHSSVGATLVCAAWRPARPALIHALFTKNTVADHVATFDSDATRTRCRSARTALELATRHADVSATFVVAWCTDVGAPIIRGACASRCLIICVGDVICTS